MLRLCSPSLMNWPMSPGSDHHRLSHTHRSKRLFQENHHFPYLSVGMRAVTSSLAADCPKCTFLYIQAYSAYRLNITPLLRGPMFLLPLSANCKLSVSKVSVGRSLTDSVTGRSRTLVPYCHSVYFFRTISKPTSLPVCPQNPNVYY